MSWEKGVILLQLALPLGVEKNVNVVFYKRGMSEIDKYIDNVIVPQLLVQDWRFFCKTIDLKGIYQMKSNNHKRIYQILRTCFV